MSAFRVSRASTDLRAVDDFYSAVFQVAPIQETETRHCFQLTPNDPTLVCYTDHSTDASDVLTVAQFEAGVNRAHETLLQGQPRCGMDKWLDNHFAFDSPLHGNTTLGDAIVALLDEDDAYYYFCQLDTQPPPPYALHYIIDPTGWGIQLDVDFSSNPAACNSFAFVQAIPACSLGVCD